MNVRKLGAYFVLGLLAVALPLVAYGWGSGDSSSAPAAAAKPPVCPQAERVSWQKLANEIAAPVYCPSWLPQPLVGNSAGDSSTVVPWIPIGPTSSASCWFESGQGLVNEVHVNLRGYPGTTRLPACEDTLTVDGETVRKKIPCFSDRQASKRVGGVDVDVYTANQGADSWHVLYAWRRNGSLYTLSQHVAPPYTYEQVVSHLDRMMRRLVLVPPTT